MAMVKNSSGKSPQFIWAASWKTKPTKIRNSFFVVIDRTFARAQHLDNLSPVYAYGGFEVRNGDYENRRPVVLIYLDKKNMVGKVEK